MKTLTQINLTALCEQSNIPGSLIRAVVRQFGGWDSFIESAPDVCRGGIDGGFHGFMYYTDTMPFGRHNRQDIAKMATLQAAEFGTSVVEMFQNFGCFRNSTKPTEEEIAKCLWAGVPTDQDEYNIYNAMAWYAGEEVCRDYCRITEQD